MFNGYNETPLISYNEFNQERIEKKQENVPKWSYGHDTGVQPAQTHLNNRHSEFWSGKSNFIGTPNLVKCSCTGCYTSSENQSYQGDNNRHRPWLPRTFPVPLNGSNESCKLTAYQWDNGLSNQGPCYPESNLSYVQENGGKYPKYPYYRHYQNSKLPEANQPGVITSVKEAEYVKKPKNEMSSRGLELSVQSAARQTVFCNTAYNLTKRVDGRNYCNPNDKYSNVASCSVEQHIPRVPVVEPFLKAVPSNLSQNRVPSTGYRSVKENIPQPYIDSEYGDARKICTEPTANSDKRNDLFSSGQLQTGVHLDCSLFNRDLSEEEQQKLYFDNPRHPDYYSRNNIQDVIKRNNLILDNRKDCAMNQVGQMSMSEQQYNVSRLKYQEMGNFKSSYEAFYPKEFEKTRSENLLPENPACFQRIEDTKNENANVHSRLPRSALLFNDPGFADKSQNSFTYQSNAVAYRNHLRPEYSYQNVNAQVRFDYPTAFQRNDLNQYRVTPQQMQSCEQFAFQPGNGLIYNHCQQNPNKTEEIGGQKNPSPVQTDFQALENRKTNYLETIRSEEINKNGSSKISPLRLLRKKKFINVPHEPTPMSSLDSAPELDVRKFWSTWAEEEEEENVAPTQMVVLDCQNIDLEQAKLLNLYETDPVRSVHVESGRIVIKGSNCDKDTDIQGVHIEETKVCEEQRTIEEPPDSEPKTDERGNSLNEISSLQQEETKKADGNNSTSQSQSENKSLIVESACLLKSPSKVLKKVKSGHENRAKKRTEIMDKWTEKKFDFLKRAEESKAAEVLRHEEEKKKIFETRLSLQQTLKKNQKLQEKNISGDESLPERIPSFDENSQSNSPQEENSDASNLPTSEYRRNKFLDYSDRKVILNGKSEIERDVAEVIDYTTEDKKIKDENVKLECRDKWKDRLQIEKEFPLLNTKIKEETGVEMEDILKKISDINFQSSGHTVENESECRTAKKWKPLAKKTKKKKSDLQAENDERTDKLTVETVSKPTIKFSIQKSHDLKISFKVLNSSKEYSDEDAGGEDVEAEGKTIEDLKNSTELITLKYKSIQRDCDRKQSLDFIKNKRGFRKKKRATEMKTPVLKIKKSRYMAQEERDPLADDDEYINVSKKPYLDEYATSDDFQVQETVDSAKIKLTFKRHNKGNFETDHKINSNNIENISEFERNPEEYPEMSKTRKKSRRAKKQELITETDAECLRDYPEPISNKPSTYIESGPETQNPQLEPVLEENSRKSSTSRDTCVEKEIEDLKPSVLTFSEIPSDTQFPIPTPENSPSDYEKSALSEESENGDAIEDSISNKETNKCEQEQVEFVVNEVINYDEDNRSEDNRGELSLLNCNSSPRVILKELTPGEVGLLEDSQEKTLDFEKEEIQDISLDFIRNTKSPEIEINQRSGKTEETNILLSIKSNTETLKKSSSDLGNLNEIKHSKSLENSYESKSEKGNDGKADESENLKIIEDSCDWKDDPLSNVVVIGSINTSFENVKGRDNDFEDISVTALPLLELENYTFRKNFETSEKLEGVIKEEKTTEVALSAEATFKSKISSPRGPDENSTPGSDLNGENLECLVEDLASDDIKCDTALLGNDGSSLISETLPEDILALPLEVENSSETEEKPIGNANHYHKSSNLMQPEPEETNQSDLELSLEEPEENHAKNDFVPVPISSLEGASEIIESIFWKNPSKICDSEVCGIFENPGPELSQKSYCSKLPKVSPTERAKIEFSPGQQRDSESPGITFEEVKLSSMNTDSSSRNAEANENEKEFEPEKSSLSRPSEKITSSEMASQDTNDLSVVDQNDRTDNCSADSKQNVDSSQSTNSSKFEVSAKKEGLLNNSLEDSYLEQSQTKLLNDVLVCTTLSTLRTSSVSQNVIKGTPAGLSLPSDIELEDGEIIDSSDELEERALVQEQTTRTIQSFNGLLNSNIIQKKLANFIVRKIERRHSTKPEKLRKRRESQNSELKTWSKRKFLKAKSCPPELKFSERFLLKKEELQCIPLREIPLPLGPPPFKSCHNFKKNLSVRTQTESDFTEAKEKPKESISPKPQQINQKEIPRQDSPSCCQSPFGLSDLQNCRNPSPPVSDKEAPSHLGIFRSSKIKFSFLKRSKFSKIDLQNTTDPQFKLSSQALLTETKSLEEPEKKEVKCYDFKKNENIRTPEHVSVDQDSTPQECEMEEVPNAKVACETKEAKNYNDSEKIQKPWIDLEQPVELLCEDLDESVRVIDPMSDFMRDEFYECEDIPTSEDLNNEDDLENEKVNDDKFRNIMQNCLDNAKKFLNVGNLKLFSCSIDDLLELDCQASESALGEKSTNHISRDVLLTSCDDTNDDLGLSENVPPADISMDFVSSFCSDVCPEILPVDNWPYLEEEVASSPIRSKQDDSDLISSLESAPSFTTSETRVQFCPNGNERPPRKRVVSENSLKSFRRGSLVSDEEALRMCSKIGVQRRKTIESFTEVSCGRDIGDIKNELAKLKNGTSERGRKSLKCRLSLEKLTNKHGINFEFKKEKMVQGNGMFMKSSKNLDYKSPSWQPKVMLFRISKNELKKIVGSSKNPKLLGPKNSGHLPKKERTCEFDNEIISSVKKQKSDIKFEEFYAKAEGERTTDEGILSDEKLVMLPQFDTIKGSLTAVSSKDPEVKKRRKARFRNLHSKKKLELGKLTSENLSGHNSRLADAEAGLSKTVKDFDRGSGIQSKNSKEVMSAKDGDEKLKKDLIEIKPSANNDVQKANPNSEKILEKVTEPSRSHDKSKESRGDRHQEKFEKTHDYRDRRREKSERREQRKHKDKHKGSGKEKRGGHDRSKRLDKRPSSGKSMERCRSASGEVENKWKNQKTAEKPWACEVCGFDDANERVLHIKSHPFHCQSCYLAFKTETHFISHLTENHKDIRNQHHCLLCELSFDKEKQYYKHLETREHRHLESVEKNTINTLFTLLTGAPCPVLGLVEMKQEWLPNQPGTVHFYHQATPLSLALQVGILNSEEQAYRSQNDTSKAIDS